MKKTKKIVALVLAAVMLVCTTVAATVAYLTAGTEYVKNTFTVGNVQIDLDEELVDQYGDTSNSNPTRTNSNSYTLVPGHEYLKDPTVYVEKLSQPCWVFVKVVNGLAGVEAAGGAIKEDGTAYVTIAKQMEANGWLPLAGEANVYYYKEVVDAREAKVSKVVFGEFMIADDADFVDESNSNADRFSDVTIDAYAVQADGFKDLNNNGSAADEAWSAAEGQWEN